MIATRRAREKPSAPARVPCRRPENACGRCFQGGQVALSAPIRGCINRTADVINGLYLQWLREITTFRSDEGHSRTGGEYQVGIFQCVGILQLLSLWLCPSCAWARARS